MFLERTYVFKGMGYGSSEQDEGHFQSYHRSKYLCKE